MKQTGDPNYGNMHQVMDVLRDALPPGVPPPCSMTVRRVAAEGVIGTYRLNRSIYFDLDDVRAWATNGFRFKRKDQS